MIEQGLVMFIQARLSGVPGGFLASLPIDQISSTAPQAWCYRSITSRPGYNLAGWEGFTEWTVQIDCHGNTGADSINLARAIDTALRGNYRGTLPDPDETYVSNIYREATQVDGYSDTNRTYVRSLEYVIQYLQI